MNPREFFKIEKFDNDTSDKYIIKFLDINPNIGNTFHKFKWLYINNDYNSTPFDREAKVFTWNEAKKFLEEVDKNAEIC